MYLEFRLYMGVVWFGINAFNMSLSTKQLDWISITKIFEFDTSNIGQNVHMLELEQILGSPKSPYIISDFVLCRKQIQRRHQGV